MEIDFLGALKNLNEDKGVSMEFMMGKISKAISTACKNSYGNENVVVDFVDKNFVVKMVKTVVEAPSDGTEISIDDAREIQPCAEVGQEVLIPLDPKQFGRIAAQTARNIIRQGIRDSERDQVVDSLRCNEGQVVSAQILRITPKTGAVILKIGDAETVLPRSECAFAGELIEGNFIKVYVLRVEARGNSPWLNVSRSCLEFVKKLFESEIPEIADGTVEIKAIAREAGFRTKVAVISSNPGVDPVGSCIGPHGLRIKEINKELGNERIDVVQFHEEPEKFIESALAPAKVISIETVTPAVGETRNACRVTVPDSQVSLAIGVKGQNVRLASRLTGWKIDLAPESGYIEDENWD
ncbi:MAG: transcription termination factor NusA [Oscillospiraceae bacterium]|jgi:N utilization substance protein A|nr:transcription termination factor NusA [Oscillospiraceae bacterium]